MTHRGKTPRHVSAKGSSFSSPHPEGQIIPRKPPRPLRRSWKRGLPPGEELRELAREYLLLQRELWPELVENGLLPEPTEQRLRAMVARFRQFFQSGTPIEEADPRWQNVGYIQPDGTRAKAKLACCYCRYSCDNSEPTSIRDQLRNILHTARAQGRFIPWELVFADYGVSGLDRSRRGYQLLQQAAWDGKLPVDTFYVDDFTRASRQVVEWIGLLAQAKKSGVRIVGASDGLDLLEGIGEVQVHFMGTYAAMQYKFIRERVFRGALGAVLRGTVLGRVPFGFAKRPLCDQHGQMLRKRNGRPVCELCIDPETAPVVREIFELYAHRGWSPGQIAKELNRRNIEGWNGRSSSTVRAILRNPVYLGVFIWNRRRTEYDPQTGKRTLVPNPRRQWVVRFRPELALVSLDLWRAARRRMAQARFRHPLTGRKASYNQIRPTTLLSGTLFCGYCGRELVLTRSGADFRSFYCRSAKDGGRFDCQLASTKGVHIVEACLFQFLLDHLLTEKAVDQLVEKANRLLAELARQPRPDVAPLERELKQLDRKLQKLIHLIEEQDDADACRSLCQRVKQLERQKAQVLQQLRKLRRQSAPPPPPLDREQMHKLLARLQQLLQQDLPRAAQVLRNLLGKVTVTQGDPPPGKRRPCWVLHFSPRLLRALAEVAEAHPDEFPDSVSTVNYLLRIWKNASPVELTVANMPRHMQLAARAQELQQQGVPERRLAKALGFSPGQLRQALFFASRGGGYPRLKKRSLVRRPSVHNAPYQGLAAEVAPLRRAGMSFRQIQAHLRQHRGQEVSVPTLERAWRFADPRAAQAAWEKDDHRAFPPEKLRELRRLLNQGVHTPAEIARLLGVSKVTVNRYRGYLQNPPWPGKDQDGYSLPTKSLAPSSTTATRATRPEAPRSAKPAPSRKK